MKKRVEMFLLLMIASAATLTLVSCKPIAYYLERVYKAYGKVTDAGTGQPIESVEVFLGTYQISVLTNGLGDYGIELADGTWTLRFVKDGYETATLSVTVNAANPRVNVDVALQVPPPPPPPPYSGPTILGATNGGLSILTNGDTRWVNYTTANGLAGNDVWCVYVSGSTIYAGTEGGLSISTNGGATWTNYLTGKPIRGAYASGATVCAGSYGNGLWISTNGGATWTNHTTANGLASNYVRRVYFSGSTVCAATEGGLSISTNGGSSWSNYTTANGLGGNLVPWVFAAGSTIYAATDGGLSISTNSGSSWTNHTSTEGLYGVVQCVFALGSTIYAGTTESLYTSSDSGASWTYNWGPPIACLYVSGSNVYAGVGTYGGAWWGGLVINNDRQYSTSDGLGGDSVRDVIVP